VSVLSWDIAEISWDAETKKMTDIAFFAENLRFKCKRCAVFCCKLGGPRMIEEDIQRLKQAGHEPEDFLDMTKDTRAEQKKGGELFMKQREDGSCIFLKYDGGNGIYRCSVYEFRPLLCRLYPFEFERKSPNTGILRFIPCCNGLNARDGAPIDGRFIEEKLLPTILGLL
jgi:Fe-S-cluster containining protein